MAGSEALNRQDLEQGSGPWRNVPNVTRTAVLALQEQLVSQSAALVRLERTLSAKADDTLVRAQSSFTPPQVARRLNDLSRVLETKADSAIAEVRVGRLSEALQSELASIQAQQSECATRTELARQVETCAPMRDALRRMASLEEALSTSRVENDRLRRSLDEKAERVEVSAMLRQVAGTIEGVSTDLQHKASTAEVAEELNRLNTVLGEQLKSKSGATDLAEKVSRDEFQEMEGRLDRRDMSSKVLEDTVAQLRNEVVLLKTALTAKAERDAVENALTERASRSDLGRYIEKSALAGELGKLESTIKSDVVSLMNESRRLPPDVITRRDLEVFAEARNSEITQLLSAKSREDQSIARAVALEAASSVGELATEAHTSIDASTRKLDRLERQIAGVVARTEQTSEQETEVMRRLERLERSTEAKVGSPSTVLTDFHSRMDDLVSDVQRLNHVKADVSEVRELRHSVGAKAEAADVESELGHLVSRSAVKSALEARPTRDELNTIMADLAKIEDVNRALSFKANIADVNAAMKSGGPTTHTLELAHGSSPPHTDTHGLRKALESKADTADVVTLLEASSTELKQRIVALEQRTGQSIRPIGGEAQGRWLWKSGETRSGHGVPWNVEVVNSAPDNFLWKKDRVQLMCVAPGLYEVTMGVFAERTPAVQLLVNGESVLSAVNSSSYVVHHSSGRLAPTGKHSAGNVTGLTLVDFLALPARARVAVSYSGVPGGQAFIGLRKL